MTQLVNTKYVLLPFLADWSTPPAWQRDWETYISSSIAGNETRSGMRAQPRVTLVFSAKPTEIMDVATIEDFIRAGAKAGYVCVPFHGRAYTLQADCTANAATLERDWNAALSGWIILFDDQENYEVQQVTAANGNIITLAGNVARTYRAGLFAWPLLFGKLIPGTATGIAPDGAENFRLTIKEETAAATTQIGNAGNNSGTGVGYDTVGTTLTLP